MKQFFPMQWRPTCGCELVYSRHFPDDTQGDYLLNNDIGFQGILRYRVKEDGSGFAGDAGRAAAASRPTRTSARSRFSSGPTERSTSSTGSTRWSATCSTRCATRTATTRTAGSGGSPIPSRPLRRASRRSPARPCPSCSICSRSYEDRTRYRARRELRERPEQEVLAALETVGRRPRQERPGILAADARGPLAAPEPRRGRRSRFSSRCSTCPEPRARAAATRVLCYWRDRVGEPLELLRKQVNDEHPRVRLEAIRALSFFDGDRGRQGPGDRARIAPARPGRLPRIHAQRDQQDARPARQGSGRDKIAPATAGCVASASGRAACIDDHAAALVHVRLHREDSIMTAIAFGRNSASSKPRFSRPTRWSVVRCAFISSGTR